MWSLNESWRKTDIHLPRITVPSLVIQSDGDTCVYPSHANNIYELLGANDKQLEMISGDHYLQDPHDARDNAADMIDGWLSQRI